MTKRQDKLVNLHMREATSKKVKTFDLVAWHQTGIVSKTEKGYLDTSWTGSTFKHTWGQ